MSYPFAATQEQMDALMGLAHKKTFPDLAAMAPENTQNFPVYTNIGIKSTTTPEAIAAQKKEGMQNILQKQKTKSSEASTTTPQFSQESIADYISAIGGDPYSQEYREAPDQPSRDLLSYLGRKYKQDLSLKESPDIQALQKYAEDVKEQNRILAESRKPQLDLSGLMATADVLTGGQYGLRAGYKAPEGTNISEIARLQKETREAEMAPVKAMAEATKMIKGKEDTGQKLGLVDLSKLQTTAEIGGGKDTADLFKMIEKQTDIPKLTELSRQYDAIISSENDEPNNILMMAQLMQIGKAAQGGRLDNYTERRFIEGGNPALWNVAKAMLDKNFNNQQINDQNRATFLQAAKLMAQYHREYLAKTLATRAKYFNTASKGKVSTSEAAEALALKAGMTPDEIYQGASIEDVASGREKPKKPIADRLADLEKIYGK